MFWSILSFLVARFLLLAEPLFDIFIKHCPSNKHHSKMYRNQSARQVLNQGNTVLESTGQYLLSRFLIVSNLKYLNKKDTFVSKATYCDKHLIIYFSIMILVFACCI